jgi:hypothetical protein
MIKANSLPEQFRDLEIYTEDWALATLGARIERRSRMSMSEITAFYNHAIGRFEEIVDHLEDIGPAAFGPKDDKLYDLLQGIIQASLVVEIQGRPAVDGLQFPVPLKVVDEAGSK